MVVVCAYNILHKLDLIQKNNNKTTLLHNPTEVYYSRVNFGFDSMRSSAMIRGRDIRDTKFAITAFELCAFGGQSGENLLSNYVGLPQYIFLETSVVSVHHARW
jgi:hypothetical protein